MQTPNQCPEDNLVYTAGLDRVEEAVISSHFMHKFVGNTGLELYGDDEFAAKSLEIDAKALYDNLIPSLLNACTAFSKDRAVRAKHRARENYWRYGLNDPRDVGLAHFIAEVMFDRQYLRGSRETCSREVLCAKVKERVDASAAIKMVILALPFKFSSPLKTRGRLPDLAEVNFILGLYEIVATIELIYKEARPNLEGRLAEFTVISDGSRFNKLVGEADNVVEEYRAHLGRWIERLGLKGYITLLDYSTLVRDRLPAAARHAMDAIRIEAKREYAKTLWPIFNPSDMGATIEAAAMVDLDPEYSNTEGRFVSLLKSLIYTINYTALQRFNGLSARQYRALYRDLISHIFEPYTLLSSCELQSVGEEAELSGDFPSTNKAKEYLRQTMLREIWSTTIEYIAEIKSARELEEDPILTCLPDHFRWTIHEKPGQLAVLTVSALGIRVQAWAGAAVFKLTKDGGIRLCTLPVLALEGAGAIPVRGSGINGAPPVSNQPLFYIYPDIAFADLDDFLFKVSRFHVRKKRS
ncbi:MAG: hypothetical protein QOI07_3193 [Verrucomicrobiota bacterium]|jgi:hypothetical protein